MRSALSVPSFQSAIEVTVIMSTLSAMVAMVMGTPLSYILARYEFRGKQVLDSIVDIPIMIPHVIVGIMIVLAFASRYSALDNALRGVLAVMDSWMRMGGPLILARPFLEALAWLISSFLGIRFINTLWGAVAAVAYLSSTYYIRVTETAIRMINPDLEAVARTLGAGPGRVFVTIVIPKAWRAMANGALLTWARSVSEAGALFIVAYYVYFGKNYVYPASVYIYESYVGIGLANAVKFSAALIIVILAIFVAYRVALSLGGSGGRG